jgi:hypothetical protein
MHNIQKHNICTNVPSSQTFRSYLQMNGLHIVISCHCKLDPFTMNLSQCRVYNTYYKIRNHAQNISNILKDYGMLLEDVISNGINLHNTSHKSVFHIIFKCLPDDDDRNM